MLKQLILHPALLFAAGNTALALGHAEVIAICLNAALVVAIFIARYVEFVTKRPFGIPFAILAAVNFATACSVVYTNIMGGDAYFMDYLAALSFIAWGTGHLFATRHERRSSKANHFSENPQVFYGVGDMAAVNASGTINPFSFPFMIVGFIKSMFIGKKITITNKTIAFLYTEATAARIYGSGFIVGAITSLAIPYFLVAQLCWGLAYFQFKKDT